MLKAFLSIFFRDEDGIDEVNWKDIVQAVILTILFFAIVLLLP